MNVRKRAVVVRSRSQRGVVLVIALIMMLLVTMLSVTTMTATTQQEKMAGNMRDRNLAFQAAESAVTFCLNQIKSNPGWVTSNKKTPTTPPTAPHWNTASTWTGTSSTTVAMGAGTTRLSAEPRCIAEDIGNGNFLVTGRAVGGTGDAIVILQATFSPS
jgi:type IV pilus assembly protein PilX